MAESLTCARDVLDGAFGHFFDWASTSPLSIRARLARTQYLHDLDSAVDSPMQLRNDTIGLDGLRAALTELFGVPSSHEVVLGRSVTELMTALSYGLTSDRRRVVVSELDHPAGVMPWSGAVGCRWDVEVAPSDGSGVIELGPLASLVDERTAVISTTHVSHIHGTIQPVEEVVRLARSHGALSVIDGAQAVGRIPVNVGAIGCDAYIGVARKALLGPLGTGFLLARRELLEVLHPVLLSTRAASIHGPSIPSEVQVTLAALPDRLEGNLPDMAALHAMWGAVESATAIGVDSVYAHSSSLIEALRHGLRDLGFRSSLRTKVASTGIESFGCHGVDCERLQGILRSKGFVVAASPAAIRVSVHLPNSATDVQQLLTEVKNAIGR